MDAEELEAVVEHILDYSDIVWTKYGAETKKELAAKIIAAIAKAKGTN